MEALTTSLNREQEPKGLRSMVDSLKARKPRQIHLTWQHPKEKWDELLGVKLDEGSYDELLSEDADVYTPEGALLLRLRKKCIPADLASAAFPILEKIKQKTNNRGYASGKIYMTNEKVVTKSGRVSNSHGVAKGGEVMSSVIGFYDRYPRIPYCRQTAFNANEPEKFAKVLPFLQAVDTCYKTIDPERYEKQMEWIRKTSPDFVINGTSYTTITVNQNFQTAVHTDQGDLKAGLSNILVLRAGEFQGAHLVFPHYRVAVKLDTCDLMLFDSHHMHGNTPLFGKVGGYKRVSLVLYYRERMIDCGTAAQELERAKRREKGDKLYGSINDEEGNQ